MKRFYTAAFSFLLLTSCQTLDGIGEDLGTAWTKSGEAIRSITVRDVTGEDDAAAGTMIKASVPDGAVPCPPVSVMDDLRTMIEFQDLSNPSPKMETGRASIRDVASRCEVVDGELAVHMDIAIDSTLGPKARWKESDKPSFAFPYFVAVTGAQGGILAKEIFAVSLSYDAKQNELSQTESITQHIPLNEDGSVPSYSVLVGFQLSEEQLAFNRTQPILGDAPRATTATP
jgi:predicted small secreted protein